MLFPKTDTLTKAARELEYVALLMATKSIPSYRRELRAAARALWNGTWTDFDFYADMLAIVRRNFTQAFHEGAATCGVTPDELSREEAQRLEQEIVNESQYIDGLADFIVLHSKANGGKLATVFRRVEVWVNAWTRIKTLAQTLVCGDLKYRWQLFPAEHCRSCRKLSGQVRRGSFWATHVQPKDWDHLACRNGCKCQLIQTDEPLSRGRLPYLP